MRGGHSVNESTLLLQDQAYQQIKAAINEGEFNRDEIFSLNALANKLNMSKTPVR
ncbi:MAG: GntR family transcriptional regulator, partial [Lachnospiraceae bacterium]|nr:GntR family transcriptional regulator [Lachnospiraceae bacterium]